MKHDSTRRALLAAAALVPALAAGCAPLVIGGAAAGTALVATDRRSAGTQLEDETIKLRVSNELAGKLGAEAHVNVTAFDRKVLLTGEVPTEAARATAATIAAASRNVRTVVNELAVMPPSTYSQRANDTLISANVKAAFVATKEIASNTLDVTTERGIVYLMGIVSRREADTAAYVAARASGVRQVVKVFDIVTPEELARMNGQSAPAASPAPAAPVSPAPITEAK